MKKKLEGGESFSFSLGIWRAEGEEGRGKDLRMVMFSFFFLFVCCGSLVIEMGVWGDGGGCEVKGKPEGRFFVFRWAVLVFTQHPCLLLQEVQ